MTSLSMSIDESHSSSPRAKSGDGGQLNSNPFSEVLEGSSDAAALPSPAIMMQAAASVNTTIQRLEGRIAFLEDEVKRLKEREEEKELIFVYGTLKRGFHNYNVYLSENAAYSGSATFVSCGKTKERFTMTIGNNGIPFMCPPAPDPALSGQVSGELFLVNAEKRTHLDYLESIFVEGDWYTAKSLEIFNEDTGKIVRAKSYVAVGDRGFREGLDRGHFDSYPIEIHEAEYVAKEDR